MVVVEGASVDKKMDVVVWYAGCDVMHVGEVEAITVFAHPAIDGFAR